MEYISSASSAGTRRGLLGILSGLIMYALYRQLSLLDRLTQEASDTKSIQHYPFPHQSNGSFPISNDIKIQLSQPRESSFRKKANSFSASKQHVEPQPRGVSFAQENTDKPKQDVATILSNNSAHQSTQKTEGGPTRKWAYAFLIGGCSSKKPEYRGFLYNVVVAAQRFEELGSKADVVVFIQMSVVTKETSLPEEDVKLLAALDVRIHYLPKFRTSINENFYALVLEKFRILELTEYSRVLFLDADIMPLCSLDYLFELSEPENGEAVLKENVVLSWRKEAANAGFFMLQPSRSDYLELQDIIYKKELKALALPWPHWDPVEGWGHRITPPDFWRSQGNHAAGTNWTWHAVFADQGLLYHWTKYAKKSVSLIIGSEVENWTSRNGTAYLEETMQGILNNYTCVPSATQARGASHAKNSPYRDIRHFTGKFDCTFHVVALVRF
jgi:hypothetical protein